MSRALQRGVVLALCFSVLVGSVLAFAEPQTPMASNRHSASTSVELASPVLTRLSSTLVLPTRMFSTLVPVCTAMPDFSNERCRALATSSSSTGTICGSISTSVTFEPKALKK